MATKKPKWMKALNRKEIKHLAEGSATGRPSLVSLKRNLAAQKATGVVCFECRSIGFKLDIPVPAI